MEYKYRYLLMFVGTILCSMNSACTSMILIDEATTTKLKIHNPGKEIKDIHIFLKENKLIVQYVGIKSSIENGRYKGTNFEIEAIYDIEKSIQVENDNKNTLLIKPVDYSERHHSYEYNQGWRELPVLLEVSNKMNKHSIIHDMGSNLNLEDYSEYIKRESYNIDAFNDLISHTSNEQTLIKVSLIPSGLDYLASKNTFDRRAVFIDTRSGEKLSYIMMMPAYPVTSGHGKKVGLILLPITVAFDLITAPIQIPLLSAASKIGN